ncbi:MAG: quinoprotein dehydrogenase-associated SoxYZ-like carrier [Proteobacteria bacterium]|nr:quinoprotein dehydrogenase-associated SoxYZ-like carrier [Pseudomonadota bacterium]
MKNATRFPAVCILFIFGLLVVCTGTRAEIKTGDNPEDSPIWQKVRFSLFQSRPIEAATDQVISLDVPVRAEDAAIVPIAIKTGFRQAPARYIDKVYLIIDNNPSPVAAIFQFTPLSGRADIETRVRIDEYTHIRAIAETNDGQLHMATRFVKAAGGCSAPPGKDAQAALATLGRMKFRVEGDATGNQPVLAQLMISHPNNSGLAMDQVSRLFTPAHFVRQVRITYGGQLVMSADVDFSISENPNFRFYFLPRGDGELKAELVDSNDLRFESALKYRQP